MSAQSANAVVQVLIIAVAIGAIGFLLFDWWDTNG